MGYACPVCEEPVPDGPHLADHLAFAAVSGDERHEAWLDEHAPGWGDGGTAELAPRVTEHADAVAFDVTTDSTRRDRTGGPEAPRDVGVGGGELDADARRVVEEAAELTRRMQGDERDESGEPVGADGDAGAEGETE